MKFRDFFTKPVLHTKSDPLRLSSGRMAIWCARDCGNYLVVAIPDQDKFDKDWICPSCHDDDRNDHFTQLESQRHTPKETH